MSKQLLDNLNEIKNQKDTYLLPENIKKDVTVLGITGTLESGSGEIPIKLFTSVEEMNASEGNNNGDIAEVYNKKQSTFSNYCMKFDAGDGWCRKITFADLHVLKSFSIPEVVSSYWEIDFSDYNIATRCDFYLQFGSSKTVTIFIGYYGTTGLQFTTSKSATSSDGINFSFSDSDYEEIVNSINKVTELNCKFDVSSSVFSDTNNNYLNSFLYVNEYALGLYQYKDEAWINRELSNNAVINAAQPTDVTANKVFFANNEMQTGSYIKPVKSNALTQVYGFSSTYSQSFPTVLGTRSTTEFHLPNCVNGDMIVLERDSNNPSYIGTTQSSSNIATIECSDMTGISSYSLQKFKAVDVNTKRPYYAASFTDKDTGKIVLTVFDVYNKTAVFNKVLEFTTTLTYLHVSGDYIYFKSNYSLYKLAMSSNTPEILISGTTTSKLWPCEIYENKLYYILDGKLKIMNLDDNTSVEIDSVYTNNVYCISTVCGLIYKNASSNYSFVRYGSSESKQITGSFPLDNNGLVSLGEYQVTSKIKNNVLYLPKCSINLDTMVSTEYDIPNKDTMYISGVAVNVGAEFDFLYVLNNTSTNKYYVYTMKDGVFTPQFNNISFPDANSSALYSDYNNYYCEYDKLNDIYLVRSLGTTVDSSSKIIKLYTNIQDIAGYRYIKIKDHFDAKVSFATKKNYSICQYIVEDMGDMSMTINYVISFSNPIRNLDTSMFYHEENNYEGTISPTEYDTAVATSYDILGIAGIDVELNKTILSSAAVDDGKLYTLKLVSDVDIDTVNTLLSQMTPEVRGSTQFDKRFKKDTDAFSTQICVDNDSVVGRMPSVPYVGINGYYYFNQDQFDSILESTQSGMEGTNLLVFDGPGWYKYSWTADEMGMIFTISEFTKVNNLTLFEDSPCTYVGTVTDSGLDLISNLINISVK